MRNWIRSASFVLACLAWANAADPPGEATDTAGPETGEVGETDELPADSETLDDAKAALIEREKDLIENDDATAAEIPQEAAPKARPLTFRVSVNATYDDNIYIQAKNPTSDLLWSLSPGVTLGVGDLTGRKGGFATLRYDGKAFYFTNNSELNSVDQVAALEVQWAGAKLTLGGTLGFSNITSPNTETGDRLNQKRYEAGLTATHDWSEKTTLGAAVSGQLVDSKDQLNTQGGDLRMWADHEVSVLTKLGLGLKVGFVDVSEGSRQTFEQLLVRVNYAAASKVNVRLEVGGELRQIESGGHADVTPVFALQANYSPYELLTVQLDGYRRVQPSIIDAGANTVVTGAGVRIGYRFLQRFELSVGGAYEQSNYEALGSGSSSPRTDDYYLARIGLSYAFAESMRLTGFYQYRTNESTEADRSFDNQQTGLEFSFAF